MKEKIIKIMWGIILISLGGLSLADHLGYVDLRMLDQQMWAISFAILSAAFFLTYFLSGIRKWGWLFPALIFASLALTISRLLENDESPILAFPILLGIAIPFYVGYALNRKQWGLLIPAYVLTVCAAIPLSEQINPELTGSLFLFAIALPFLIVFLFDNKRKWALITASVIALIGVFPLVNLLYLGDFQGPVVTFLISLPFFVTYFLSPKNWWALIPAGVFSSISLVALLESLFHEQAYLNFWNLRIGVFSSVLFFGFALTFGALWLRRASQPTDWAKYPAICLLFASLLYSPLGKPIEDYLPAITLLVIGLAIILVAFFKRSADHQTSS